MAKIDNQYPATINRQLDKNFIKKTNSELPGTFSELMEGLGTHPKIHQAMAQLKEYYGDKSDHNGDGKPDHYNPDFVDMLENREVKEDMPIKFKFEDLSATRRRAQFATHQTGIDKPNAWAKLSIDNKLKDAPVTVVGSVIAHELCHLNDYRNHNFSSASENSIFEEYDCLKVQNDYVLDNGSKEDIIADNNTGGWLKHYIVNGKKDNDRLYDATKEYPGYKYLPKTSSAHENGDFGS